MEPARSSSVTDAPAANRLPLVNSWSRPAIGTPCSVTQPLTVPCDTPLFPLGRDDTPYRKIEVPAFELTHVCDEVIGAIVSHAPSIADDDGRYGCLVGGPSMLFIGFTVMGYISYTKLPVELFPNVELPVLIVHVRPATDVDPKYMERQAIIPATSPTTTARANTGQK